MEEGVAIPAMPPGMPAAVSPPSAENKPATSREGQLEYDIPGQMQTGKSYKCKVNIAGTEVAASGRPPFIQTYGQRMK